MSHFAVLVFGDNVEEQLQPFHQFECTGIDDEYVEDDDITDEVQDRINDGESLEDALGYYGLENYVSDESELDEDHKYGYAIVKNGKLVLAVNRTNPNYQWDWWVEGGRWSGFLKLKDGATGKHGERSWTNSNTEIPSDRCDSALKGDIDIEGMRNDAAELAAGEYDTFASIVRGREWETWSSVRNRIEDIDEARDFYNNQEVVKDLRTNRFYFDIEGFAVTKEEYVSAARNSAISTFAVLKDGEWYERGTMGWWGISTGDKDQDVWNQEISNLIDSVPDDTRLTVVDCHI